MKLLRFHLIVLTAVLLLTLSPFGTPALTCRAASPGGPVTAVSDTSSDDDASGVVLDTLNEDQNSDARPDTWLKFNDRCFPGSGLFNLFGLGSVAMTTIFTIFMILFNLLPVLLIILAVYLIVRHSRRKRDAGNAAMPGGNAAAPAGSRAASSAMPQPVSPLERINKNKNNAVLLISSGIGIVIFFLIIYVKFCIALGCFLICLGVGMYINAKREERNYNDGDRQ